MSDFNAVVPPSEVKTYSSGMTRSTDEGKIDYSLAIDGVMFERLAKHLMNGIKAGYEPRNWMKAIGNDSDGKVRERAKSSATRHFVQWLKGDTTEDHAAAVLFNINLYESINNCKAKDKVPTILQVGSIVTVKDNSGSLQVRCRGVYKGTCDKHPGPCDSLHSSMYNGCVCWIEGPLKGQSCCYNNSDIIPYE